MPNRLAGESSPYLLQHKDNPVEWYPWGPEALELAHREDKPIFLSIGYAACHWCHVMAHESFEDPGTARIMNEHFVNIKVDREERPDLDGIYMDAVVALTGQGGWPMSVFLTPDGRPFFGGTYFPPSSRFNLPSFQEVLTSIARIWETDRERAETIGAQLADRIRSGDAFWQVQDQLEPDILDQAAMQIAQSYDWQHGGWGAAPKFPQPMTIEFLLRRAVGGDRFALDIATHALQAMARGGMYDVVGGGFARYSVDERWLVPHFEKMLYDNAQLAQVYLHAYKVTGDPLFRQICTETLDFVARELTDHQGGFYSSLDADSEGEEGKFYMWALEEIQNALVDTGLTDLVIQAYGVTQHGNFEGRNILQRQLDDEKLAEAFSLPPEGVREKLSMAHQRLLTTRESRVRPGTDDKVLASWNGLMLIAFAEAARYLERPDYREVATRNGRFLLEELYTGDRLMRAWRQGQVRHNGYLEDYGAVIQGLLALYQTDGNPRWFQAAGQMTDEMLVHFEDPQGGFFDTRADHEDLLVRPKELQDNATPSGNALAAGALLQMAALTGQTTWREQAERSLSAIQPAIARYPTAFGQWLSALAFALNPVHEIAILGDPADPATRDLVRAVWSRYRPFSVVALSPPEPPEGAPPLLNDRPLLKGQPSAYVCRNFVCDLPVAHPQSLRERLGDS